MSKEKNFEFILIGETVHKIKQLFLILKTEKSIKLQSFKRRSEQKTYDVTH